MRERMGLGVEIVLPGDEEIHVVSFKNLVLPFIGLDQACLLLDLIRRASYWP